MTPAERRVADFMQENREEVMVSSAAAIALRASTSDATVIRTTQALGYSGLEELRQTLAAEMRGARSLPNRLYKELDLLLAEATRLKLRSILITDGLKGKLQRRVTLALAVPRGKARLLSMHTATLGLLEALLVGVATQSSTRIGASLDRLNNLREKLAGKESDGAKSR